MRARAKAATSQSRQTSAMAATEALDQAEHVLQTLAEMQKRGSMADEQKVNYVMSLEKETMHEDMGALDRDVICHTM